MWHLWETREVHTGFWWGDLREGGNLHCLGLDWKILLKCIFKKCDGNIWPGSSSRQGEVAGTCECGNEPLSSIKCGGFLD